MIQEFIGHFHPLFVHLPIGILAIAVLLKWWFIKKPIEQSAEVMSFVLKIAFVSAVFSCITGYVLQLGGGYDEEMVSNHQWVGIALTVFTGVLAFKDFPQKVTIGILGIISILLAVTGHLGGSITHGEDYLSFKPAKKERAPITDINKAVIYSDIVQPILEEKCYTCHSSKKQKGELRLDTAEWITKGGENGTSFVAHDTENSILFQRLLLPEVEKEHMPPKGKPQPTENEIKLIEWWINEGGDYKMTVAETKDRSQVAGALKSLTAVSVAAISTIPFEKGREIDSKALEALKETGAVVLPVGESSNYLSVNYLGKKSIDVTALQAMLPLKDNIVWLKLNDTNVDDKSCELIAECENLTQLYLGGTAITNEGLKELASLDHLQVLNLTNTAINNEGLKPLSSLKDLRNIYLFGSKVDKNNWSELEALFPNASLDSGGYVVPTLATDTVMVVKGD
ncbi:Uncharacterized membrane protein [Spirosomataceae bacterium TFI 002]|nr:Uncharacterized membrane protein [Spirosomataceae bacterium TFI 002]